MIFLGAGASKAFGIKTLQEMSKALIEIMEKKGYSDTVEKINKSLKRFGIAADFEAIYTIVEGLTNPEKAVKNNGPFTAYVCKDLKELKPKHDLEDLLQVFKSFLLKECRLKRDSHKRIEQTYDKLFKTIKDSGKTENRYITGVEGVKEQTMNVGYTIATTNYDMVFESYQRIKRQQYADGFRPIEGDPFIKEMDLKTYSKTRERWLIKLHGSIWQYKYGDTIFKTIEDPNTSSIPVRIEEEMLIYPTGEKPILRHPYYGFYNIFKSQRWKKLIVIGYSFRDDPVNTAFVDNLERTEHSNLIVVNPNPAKVIQNLGVSTLSKFNQRIIPVKGEFGDKETFEKLRLALKVESKRRYNERYSDFSSGVKTITIKSKKEERED